jgi:hypothetical protein
MRSLSQYFSQLSSGPVGSRTRCTFDLKIFHSVSDTLVARFLSSYPTNSVNSASDSEYEHIAFLDTQSKQQAKLGCFFSISRGRISVQCTSKSSNETWNYEANFDLESKTDKEGDSIDLVLTDSNSQNTLYIRVVCISAPDENNSESIDLSYSHLWTITKFYFELKPVQDEKLPVSSQPAAHPSSASSSTTPTSSSSPVSDSSSNQAPILYVPMSTSSKNIPSKLESNQSKLPLLQDLDYSDPNIFDKIQNRISEIAVTQSGSRFLQDCLDTNDAKKFEIIFNDIFSALPSLMTNLFGNYFCQKLISKGSEHHWKTIIERCHEEFCSIACDRQGTRTIQTLISSCAPHFQLRASVIRSVQEQLISTMCNSNGTHAVQLILSTFPESELSFLYDAALNQIRELSLDQHGLCVVKQCITLSDQRNPQRLQMFVQQSMPLILEFINDPFGNYLVQHILDCRSADFRYEIHQHLKHHYTQLACQKYSSNVIEKLLRTANSVIQNEISTELLNSGPITNLLNDNFGTYVLQHLLEITSQPQQQYIRDAAAAQYASMKKSIQRKWERLIRSPTSDLPVAQSAVVSGLHQFHPRMALDQIPRWSSDNSEKPQGFHGSGLLAHFPAHSQNPFGSPQISPTSNASPIVSPTLTQVPYPMPVPHATKSSQPAAPAGYNGVVYLNMHQGHPNPNSSVQTSQTSASSPQFFQFPNGNGQHSYQPVHAGTFLVSVLMCYIAVFVLNTLYFFRSSSHATCQLHVSSHPFFNSSKSSWLVIC